MTRSLWNLLAAVVLTAFALPAHAQRGPTVDDSARPSAARPVLPSMDLRQALPVSELNPINVLDGAMGIFPSARSSFGGAAPTAPSSGASSDPKPAGGLSAAVNVLVLLTVVTLAPSIMLMTTCFLRISIVLGLLKQAIGTSSVPPPQIIVALSLFMTLLVMSPTIDRINAEAITPYKAGTITDHEQLWDRAKQPIRDFMFDQIEATNNWSSVYMLLNYRGVDTTHPEQLTRSHVDLITLVPAYMLSELKTAFLMGFRVYLPFLVIDMVISSLLISMSMMMLPPVMISLPFKLLLFVMVDGWQLVVGSLMHSFAQPGDIPDLSKTTAMLTPIFNAFT